MCIAESIKDFADCSAAARDIVVWIVWINDEQTTRLGTSAIERILVFVSKGSHDDFEMYANLVDIGHSLHVESKKSKVEL